MLPLHNKIKLSWEPQHAHHPLGGISNTTRCQATVRRKTGSVVRSLEQSVLTKTRWVKFASVFSLICSPQNKYNIINQVRTTQKAFFTLAIFKKFVYKALQINPCCPTPNCWSTNTKQLWPETNHELQSPVGGSKGENGLMQQGPGMPSLTQMTAACPGQARRQTFILKNKDSQKNLLLHSRIAVFTMTTRLERSFDILFSFSWLWRYQFSPFLRVFL